MRCTRPILFSRNQWDSGQTILPSAQPRIILFSDGFPPLGRGFRSRHLYGNVRKPAVLFSAVPMLDPRRDRNHRTGRQADSLLAFLLIPALAGDADENLSASLRRMVNMLVVPASGLKGYVRQEDRALTGRSQGIEK